MPDISHKVLMKRKKGDGYEVIYPITTSDSVLIKDGVSLADLEPDIMKKSVYERSIVEVMLQAFSTRETITREIFNNPSYPKAYLGDINFGKEVGLKGIGYKVIYIPHADTGYGTQLVIPMDSGENNQGILTRTADKKVWSAWGYSHNVDAMWNETTDASNAKSSNVLYYPKYNACANLPRGTNDDGIILPLFWQSHCGFQLYFTWNNQEVWWRNIS